MAERRVRLREWFGEVSWFLSGLKGSDDLAIRYRPERAVRVRGRVPRSRVPGIVAFFARDLRPVGAATVRGTLRGGAWHLRFTSGLTAAERQRVRNFLAEHLR